MDVKTREYSYGWTLIDEFILSHGKVIIPYNSKIESFNRITLHDYRTNALIGGLQVLSEQALKNPAFGPVDRPRYKVCEVVIQQRLSVEQYSDLLGEIEKANDWLSPLRGKIYFMILLMV